MPVIGATLTALSFVLFLSVFFSPGFLLVGAVLQTRFIDDQLGEKPTFVGSWNSGPACTGCSLQPDPHLAFGGTWKDTTHHATDLPVSVQINFTGVAIELFCIVPNSPASGVTAAYDLTFTLDGKPAGNPFSHTPDFKNDFTYNVSVFSMGSLANIPHTVVMKADSKNLDSAILFDFAQYTFDDGTPVQSTTASTTSTTASTNEPAHDEPNAGSGQQSNPAIIVVAVLVPLLLLVLIILLVMIGYRCGYFHRRKRSQEYPRSEEPIRTNVRQWAMQQQAATPPSSFTTTMGYSGQLDWIPGSDSQSSPPLPPLPPPYQPYQPAPIEKPSSGSRMVVSNPTSTISASSYSRNGSSVSAVAGTAIPHPLHPIPDRNENLQEYLFLLRKENSALYAQNALLRSYIAEKERDESWSKYLVEARASALVVSEASELVLKVQFLEMLVSLVVEWGILDHQTLERLGREMQRSTSDAEDERDIGADVPQELTTSQIFHSTTELRPYVPRLSKSVTPVDMQKDKYSHATGEDGSGDWNTGSNLWPKTETQTTEQMEALCSIERLVAGLSTDLGSLETSSQDSCSVYSDNDSYPDISDAASSVDQDTTLYKPKVSYSRENTEIYIFLEVTKLILGIQIA
ncbi:hypothetical protein V5O48_004345 [Marasmius crinis-equi]|uniref:Uncharacterized protein n=1 Tax=Marasmius crinis-equi TaxID=585013 RepID=A0ABR3FQD9_9AGAR